MHRTPRKRRGLQSGIPDAGSVILVVRHNRMARSRNVAAMMVGMTAIWLSACRSSETGPEVATGRKDVATEYSWPPSSPPAPGSQESWDIVYRRWQQASTTRLGSEADGQRISGVVLRHMGDPKAEVEQIRWLSPKLVMVHSYLYSGPLAAAFYFYVVEKENDRWEVVAYYLIGMA